MRTLTAITATAAALFAAAFVLLALGTRQLVIGEMGEL